MDEVGVYCPFNTSGQCLSDCTTNADRVCVNGAEGEEDGIQNDE